MTQLNKHNSDTLKQKISEHTSAIMRDVVELRNENSEQIKKYEKFIDEIFCEVITIVDTFERSEQIIKEKGYDDIEQANKSIKRLLNAKKKTLSVLEKYSVKPITFEEGKLIDNLCVTIGTEPDASRNDGDIISIEKTGYTRNGRVIRYAEVVIVKN